MKQDANFPFDMSELVERYGIKRQSLLEYVKNHITTLNESQVHARKFGKEWKFDTVAVRRLDELRGYIGTAIAVVEYESPEAVRAREAEAELEQAKQRIEELQKELQEKDKTIGLQVKLLADEKANSEQKLLLLTSEAEAESKKQATRIAELENEKATAEAESKANLDRAMSAEAKYKAEINKGLIERIKDWLAR
jgi:DNA repair exonuclease SbcCD ATPase subunit